MNVLLRSFRGGLPGLIVLLASWEIVTRWDASTRAYFPPFSEVLATLVALVANGEILHHAVASLSRVAEGYVLAAMLALSAGLCLGRSRVLRDLFQPLIEILRPMPSPATIPIAILFFGIGQPTNVAVTAYACFWPILINTIDGVRAIDPVLLDTSAVFRLQAWDHFRKVIVPAATPHMATGLRVSLAIALILVTTSEMVVSNDGLGFYILDQQRSFKTREMYAAITMVAVIGYVLNRLFREAAARVLAWHRTPRNEEFE